MSTLIVLSLTALVWLAITVAVGRAAVPRAERTPLRRWNAADVVSAATIGIHQITRGVQAAHRQTWAGGL